MSMKQASSRDMAVSLDTEYLKLRVINIQVDVDTKLMGDSGEVYTANRALVFSKPCISAPHALICWVDLKGLSYMLAIRVETLTPNE